MPNVPWNAEFAESLKGKYCMIQATYLNEQDEVWAVEQIHGIVMDLHPDRGIWFRLKGKREGKDWIGPPDLKAFEKAPGNGEYKFSETGEVLFDVDYVIFWKFHENPAQGDPE